MPSDKFDVPSAARNVFGSANTDVALDLSDVKSPALDDEEDDVWLFDNSDVGSGNCEKSGGALDVDSEVGIGVMIDVGVGVTIETVAVDNEDGLV